MQTLPKFDGQIERFVIPKYLTHIQQLQFRTIATEIEEKHLADPTFVEGERFMEFSETLDEIVLKAIQNLCEMVGFSAYYGKNLSGWLFGLSC